MGAPVFIGDARPEDRSATLVPSPQANKIAKSIPKNIDNKSLGFFKYDSF
jgi:hypothetical protein